MADRLEQRVRLLEDCEAIKDLKARYGYYCDDNYNSNAIARLFVSEGVWNGGSLGRYEGREQIRAWFDRASDVYSFTIHWIFNPLIVVDADEARATWYLLMAGTLKKDGWAIWNAAKYEDEMVRENGVWMFRSMVLEHVFTTPYEVGWAKERFVL